MAGPAPGQFSHHQDENPLSDLSVNLSTRPYVRDDQKLTLNFKQDPVIAYPAAAFCGAD
jgi:hypothetical protein